MDERVIAETRRLTRGVPRFVMRGLNRVVRTLAVLLLALFLGAHWLALQSVGWATMLVTRTQTSGWQEAVRTTFDGLHPCAVCRLVAAGKKAESEQVTVYKPTKLESAAMGEPLRIPDPPLPLPVLVEVTCIPSSPCRPPLPPPPRAA